MLWGPIKKKERSAYTYFSCSALKYLSRIAAIGGMSATYEINAAVIDGCNTLLNSFKDNDFQYGWGITLDSEPTVFHTAYSVNTLLSINPDFKNTFQIIKASAFLKNCYLKVAGDTNYSHFCIGDSEIYQYKTSRLTYIHSVDIYVLFALLRSYPSSISSYIRKEYERFVKCAECTDWRYRNYVTGWRLFDIVSFCNYYENLLEIGETAPMKHFKIALTFAGETRTLVKEIAEYLSAEYGKDCILYDKYYEAEFARPQLDSYLQDLYHNHSDLIVVFICPQYAEKRWCGVEWRAIKDILNKMDYERIMYVKASSEDINSILLPGFYASEDGYIESEEHTTREIADLIIQRYNQLNQ